MFKMRASTDSGAGRLRVASLGVWIEDNGMATRVRGTPMAVQGPASSLLAGGIKSNKFATCADLFYAGSGTPSGGIVDLYPDGPDEAPVKVWCMAEDGFAWTMVRWCVILLCHL